MDVRRADILLAMESVFSHIPQRSLDDFPKLARLMFPDSNIAARIQMGRTKIGYNISHGLAPYYEDKLYKILTPTREAAVSPKFIACYNSVTHNKQFDVHIIYFDDETKRVSRKYLSSLFVGDGDAQSSIILSEH